jgi:hypothetical protein
MEDKKSMTRKIEDVIKIMQKEGNHNIREIDFYDPNDRGTHIKVVRSV